MQNLRKIFLNIYTTHCLQCNIDLFKKVNSYYTSVFSSSLNLSFIIKKLECLQSKHRLHCKVILTIITLVEKQLFDQFRNKNMQLCEMLNAVFNNGVYKLTRNRNDSLPHFCYNESYNFAYRSMV